MPERESRDNLHEINRGSGLINPLFGLGFCLFMLGLLLQKIFIEILPGLPDTLLPLVFVLFVTGGVLLVIYLCFKQLRKELDALRKSAKPSDYEKRMIAYKRAKKEIVFTPIGPVVKKEPPVFSEYHPSRRSYETVSLPESPDYIADMGGPFKIIALASFGVLVFLVMVGGALPLVFSKWVVVGLIVLAICIALEWMVVHLIRGIVNSQEPKQPADSSTMQSELTQETLKTAEKPKELPDDIKPAEPKETAKAETVAEIDTVPLITVEEPKQAPESPSYKTIRKPVVDDMIHSEEKQKRFTFSYLKTSQGLRRWGLIFILAINLVLGTGYFICYLNGVNIQMLLLIWLFIDFILIGVFVSQYIKIKDSE
ncbi:MAG: hypothetical protein LBR25_10355 [Erysipelotrichaceae bacterium]|jgi:hypothetical protein|nr:hypothetical protein [Erysipelotrichaceae bacterium]